MNSPKLTELDYLPTNSHALIRALKAELDDWRVSPPNPAIPLDIQFAMIQRVAGAAELVAELYEMMLEDLEEQDADANGA